MGLPLDKSIKLYPAPRRGIFSVDSPCGTYSLPEGWKCIEKEYEIIGEHKLFFVKQLHTVKHEEWGKKPKEYISGIGPHKTRLVRWITGQLELF